MKLLIAPHFTFALASHPAGVRGLKHKIRYTHVPNEGRTPQGCVD